MVGKRSLTCAKCGVTSKEDSSLSFHRFPLASVHGSLKAKVWAIYCFPNDEWTSDQSLYKLYKQYKVLCGKHFDDSAYTCSERKRLNKFAIPFEAHNILAQVRNELQNPGLNTQANEVEVVPEVQPSTSQCTILTSVEQPNKQSLQSTNVTKGPHKGILKEIGFKTLHELTPRKLKMYKRCRKNVSEILRLRRNIKQIKKCKRNILEELHSNEAVQEILQSKMTSPFYLLLQSQLKNTGRKLVGRRWTLDDKILALSLYKKSSSCYRLLRRLVCLPSISSLKALLNKIPLMCGINKQVMETVKEIAQKRPVEDNLCVLAFDEMSIRKNLTYNSRLDQIDGYQDHAGQGRTPEVACKAITFMAIGIRKKWKQPIAFYFSGSHVTADRLTALIKEVLGACYEAGLEVISTVNDCDGVNLRALNSLGSSTERPFFDFEGHEIVTILDPPHLLKCFRNNFMKHDIEFSQDMQIDGKESKGVASWKHIEALYNIEKTNPNFVFAPALTQSHLQPNGKQKMKVRLAAQVLSHSVAAGLFAKVAQNELSPDATATATVVADMDKLFDSVNGDSPDRKRGKPLLTNMSSTSLHLEFFIKMKKFFKQMKFLGAKSKPPSQEGWLRTINGIERLQTNLKKYNVKTLSPRRLNQDPLENCFGCIRNNCGSNPNPTSVQFIAALKTSMVTNLINNNKNRNCLDDENDLLNNFKVFLTKGANDPVATGQEEISPSLKTIEGAGVAGGESRPERPYFDDVSPRNVTAVVGQAAVLRCRAKHIGNRTVSWMRKRDLHILTSHIFTYTGDGRFSVLHPEPSDDWDLKIDYVQPRDAGVYECQINTEPKINMAVLLHVEGDSIDESLIPATSAAPRSPAAAATIWGSQDVYVKKGSTISLTCSVNVHSSPPSSASVLWYHGNAVVDFDSPRGGISLETEKTEGGTTSKLLVTKAALADSGNYTCVPNNAHPASVAVHVLNGEHPAAMQTSNRASSYLSSRLSCAIITYLVSSAAGR